MVLVSLLRNQRKTKRKTTKLRALLIPSQKSSKNMTMMIEEEITI